MDMLRQDLQTVLFMLSPLEVLHPFPVPSSLTILRTTKGEQFFCPAPEGSPFTEGDGGRRHFLSPVFRTFYPL